MGSEMCIRDRPRSVPVRERPGLSHPHSVDAAVGSPLSQVSGVSSASPNKTEFGDLGVEHSSPRPVKASAGVRNVRNDAPAPAGNSREPHDEPGRLLPEPPNPIYDSTENEQLPVDLSAWSSTDSESTDASLRSRFGNRRELRLFSCVVITGPGSRPRVLAWVPVPSVVLGSL